MVKHRSMRKSRSRSRSVRRSAKRSAQRSARKSRSMRGGRLTGDSSYSSLIASSSDNSSYLAGSSGAALQNTDRNNSLISGEGANINMSAPAFQGLYPPQAYYGGKRRSRRRTMRGGVAINALQAADLSVAYKSDLGVAKFETTHGGLDEAQMSGGRRRRRSMKGGEDADPMPTEPVNPDKEPIEGMYDNNLNADVTNPVGGRRKRRGGGVIATAALPFGLFGLQKLYQGRRTNKTRKYRR